jgi:hypothetical protein
VHSITELLIDTYNIERIGWLSVASIGEDKHIRF